ncbi:MAG: peptidoglycan bridge formation glycyltransferase FemA/FemB family protein [Bacteroidales bacterium]|nr:peptidoglycan bridge formation glycyltransferase FemA/FemB family protein [Bacteroidales bacterium]
MIDFKILIKENIPWKQIESCYDSNIFKTHLWSSLIFETHGYYPFVVEISDSDSIIGYFIGMRIKKMGITIVASPFEGCTTSYQGLSTLNQISRSERVSIYKELIKWLFEKRYCLLFQVSDWNIDYEDIKDSEFYSIPINSYWLDLRPDIDTLFKSFKQKSCQYSIHKAEKQGVRIVKPQSPEEFANNYYAQLIDVFKKQNLKPTYSKKYTLALVRKFYDTDKVIMLEAFHPIEEKCIATILFLTYNDMAFYWGAASYREYQKFCPNELLMFEAIKKIKERGCDILEMEGIRSYKEKYNPIRYAKPKIVTAKYSILITMKKIAQKTYYRFRAAKASLKL